ncbi:MAG: cyclic nucleotide-binding domain-containing protein [Desulfobacteraceae bacterium]|nr:cyclic nucleotide-binding domain-containing protein [Desulfobacteraceae bacterium]
MRKILYIFGQLSDEDIDWLACTGSVERVAAGTTIITRGFHVEYVYIVLEGSFAVLYTDAPPAEVFAKLKSGEIIGEMSFIDAAPPSATVQAETSSLVLKIPKSDLQAKLDRDTGFAARFYRSTSILLSDRLRSLSKKMAHPEEAESMENELDPNAIEGISIAGKRFDAMLKQLRSRTPGQDPRKAPLQHR